MTILIYCPQFRRITGSVTRHGERPIIGDDQRTSAAAETFPRRSCRRAIWLFTAIACYLLCGTNCIWAQATLGELRDAWKRRQDSVKSLIIAWDSERTQMQGSLSAQWPERMARRWGRGDFPPQDTTIPQKFLLIVDGERSRFHVEMAGWNLSTFEFGRIDSTWIFDGERCVDLTEFPDRDPPSPREVFIRRADDQLTFQMAEVDPVGWFFWGLSAARGALDGDTLRLTDEHVIIDGHDCLQLHGDENGIGYIYWVDPASDFVVRRVESSNPNSKMRTTCNVRYREQPPGHWQPEGWTWETTYLGALLRREKTTVTRLVVNPRIERSTFDTTNAAEATATDSPGECR
jgi:hypothetical protein